MTANVLAGRYELARPLGAAGRTWLARDTVLHRDVAITRIPLPPGPRDRILSEARSAAGLSHPALVTVHDVLTDPDAAWIIADYVRGRSLDQIVQAAGPISPGHTAKIGLRLLDALTAVHGQGLTHRAVVPANVLIAETGEVVLAGLGLTPAPEPSPGHPENPGPRGDLRALGATLLFALEGRGAETGPPRPGPLAHVVHSLMYGPHDLRAIRATLTTTTATAGTEAIPVGTARRRPPVGRDASGAPATTGPLPGTEPSGVARGSVRVPRPILLGVAATGIAVVVTAVILLTQGRMASVNVNASATPGVAATASGKSATPSGSGPADPCALVAPDHRRPLEPATSCSVQVGAADVAIKTHRDVATARTILAAVRKRQQSKAGQEGTATTPVRDVPGLGDEGFTQDVATTIFPSASSTVWVRIDAWTIEIVVRNSQTEVTPDMRSAAMSAARSVAAALGRSS